MIRSAIIDRQIHPSQLRSSDLVLVNAEGGFAGVEFPVVSEDGISKTWVTYFFWSTDPGPEALQAILARMRLTSDNRLQTVGEEVEEMRGGPPEENGVFVRDVELEDVKPIFPAQN